MSFLIFLLLICILFIIIALKQGHYVKCKDIPLYKHMLASDIPFKAGDLLLFSNSSYKVINRTFGNNYYSHVGIVVEENGRLYSMELTNYPILNKEQIYIDLFYRIENYSGQIFYKQLNNNIFVDKNKLIEISKRNYNFNSLINNCAIFILNTLKESGIANINYNKLLFWKTMDKVVYCENYDNPIKIIPDKMVIKNINENKKLNVC